MIIYCEECGAKNTISPENIKGAQSIIKCSNCNDNLRFYHTSIFQTIEPDKISDLTLQLVLKYKKKVIETTSKETLLTIGRKKGNDIQVRNPRASKSHAYIKYMDGKFLLRDQSTNGTYVLIKGREGIILRKDELLLKEKGVIGMGYKVQHDSKNAIHFSLEPVF